MDAKYSIMELTQVERERERERVDKWMSAVHERVGVANRQTDRHGDWRESEISTK